MKCKYCGKEIDAGSIFCGYCGKKQPSVKHCIKCGQEIGLDDAFCGFCGAPQNVGKVDEGKKEEKEQEKKQTHTTEQAKEATSISQESSIVSKPKDKKWMLLVPVIFLLVAAGMLGYHYKQQRSSTSVSNQESEMAVNEVTDNSKTGQTSSASNQEGENDGPPTIQQLMMFFENMSDEGIKNIFSDYGFELVSEKSEKGESGYEDCNTIYTIYYKTFQKHYKIINKNHEIQDGWITVECSFSDFGDGDYSMKIKCDKETWKYLKDSADETLEERFTNIYSFDNECYHLISFEKPNAIRFYITV